MKAVFVHKHGPGQFRHLAADLARRNWNVTVLCEAVEMPLAGVRFVQLDPPAPRSASDKGAVAAENVGRASNFADALLRLARHGAEPDVVIGHIGWGSMLFAKDALPNTPMLGYCEYFYRSEGADLGFDPQRKATLADRRRLRLRNMVQLATLDGVDAGVSPTAWQRSLYPTSHQSGIAICHDGIDTDASSPLAGATLTLPGGRTLTAGDPVVTYVARTLEPYRGFPQFMRAAGLVAARNPAAIFVVVGEDGNTYGPPRPDGRLWRHVMMEETGLDPARIHFLGKIEHRLLTRLFQVSAAHIYLTYPFVLSWSVLEAMACGAVVIASDTTPVREAIVSGRDGILTDFWDPSAIASSILDVLRSPDTYQQLRIHARRKVQYAYALERCLTAQRHILRGLLAGRGAGP